MDGPLLDAAIDGDGNARRALLQRASTSPSLFLQGKQLPLLHALTSAGIRGESMLSEVLRECPELIFTSLDDRSNTALHYVACGLTGAGMTSKSNGSLSFSSLSASGTGAGQHPLVVPPLAPLALHGSTMRTGREPLRDSGLGAAAVMLQATARAAHVLQARHAATAATGSSAHVRESRDSSAGAGLAAAVQRCGSVWQTVQALVQAGNDRGLTPVHIAAACGNTLLLAYLQQQWATASSEPLAPSVPLPAAADRASDFVLHGRGLLQSHNGSPGGAGGASGDGSHAAEAMLHAGARLTVSPARTVWPALLQLDASSRSPLVHAIVAGHGGTVQWIMAQLQAGAEGSQGQMPLSSILSGVGGTDRYGTSPLHYAVTQCQPDLCRALLCAIAGRPYIPPGASLGFLLLSPRASLSQPVRLALTARDGRGWTASHSAWRAMDPLGCFDGATGNEGEGEKKNKGRSSGALAVVAYPFRILVAVFSPSFACWAQLRAIELQCSLAWHAASGIPEASSQLLLQRQRTGSEMGLHSNEHSHGASASVPSVPSVGQGGGPGLQVSAGTWQDGKRREEETRVLPSSYAGITLAYLRSCAGHPLQLAQLAFLGVYLHLSSHGAGYLWPFLSTWAWLTYITRVGPLLESVAAAGEEAGWSGSWQSLLHSLSACFLLFSTLASLCLFHTRALGAGQLVSATARRKVQGPEGMLARAQYLLALRTGEDQGARMWQYTYSSERRAAEGGLGAVLLSPQAAHPTLAVQGYCSICAVAKLPRTKHCSVCGVCVPGFDHHCAWTGGCVSSTNHGAFLLFVAAATATATCWAGLMALYVHSVPAGAVYSMEGPMGLILLGASSSATDTGITSSGWSSRGLAAHAAARPVGTLVDALCLGSCIFGVVLLVQHVRLVGRGLKTAELMSVSAAQRGTGRRQLPAYLTDPATGRFRNPFSYGSVRGNCWRFWGVESRPLPCGGRPEAGDRGRSTPGRPPAKASALSVLSLLLPPPLRTLVRFALRACSWKGRSGKAREEDTGLLPTRHCGSGGGSPVPSPGSLSPSPSPSAGGGSGAPLLSPVAVLLSPGHPMGHAAALLPMPGVGVGGGAHQDSYTHVLYTQGGLYAQGALLRSQGLAGDEHGEEEGEEEEEEESGHGYSVARGLGLTGLLSVARRRGYLPARKARAGSGSLPRGHGAGGTLQPHGNHSSSSSSSFAGGAAAGGGAGGGELSTRLDHDASL